MHSIMAKFNVSQDVANERERKYIDLADHIVAKSYPYCKLWECVVTVLFLTSTPLVLTTQSRLTFDPRIMVKNLKG